jgi:ribonuclease T2
MLGALRAIAFSTLAVGAVLATLSGSAVAQSRQQGEPGKFDYYVLSLSWSPSFCETATGRAREEQCGPRRYSFVVHGLWPQYERGFPENCEVPAPRLDHRIMSGMLDLMPAPGLIYHEWDAHGTCSGLSQSEYFETIRKARTRVSVPPAYENLERPLTVTPAQVIDAFVKANKGLAASGIAIDCDRTRLREVRICMTRDLTFRDCGRDRACRSDSLVMPPVRGL